MESRFERVKAIVLHDLRNAHRAITQRPEVIKLSANNYAGTLPSVEDRIELMSVLQWLVSCGIIIPGDRSYGFGLDNFNLPFKAFPHFAVTEFGMKALDPSNADTDPHDRAKYVAEVVRRMPDASPEIRAYLSEATETYDHQHYLAAAVLIGVAAEELIERLYKSFASHLIGARGATFDGALKKERWASARFKVFSSYLALHRTELPTELANRVDTYLDLLISLIKTSRDDGGHGRPTRVDRDIAYGNLVYFPSLVGIVAELEQALKSNCSVS